MSAQNPVPFSCFLIGGDTLLLECAEIIKRKGHQILGIITSTPRITRWAREHEVRAIDAGSDYAAVMAETPFDHFFAVTHLAIIPEKVLALPRKLAINFHDGPLPRYAGLNTPAWALINGETSYGITWHVMTQGLDTGDILKQVLFDVSPGETSLSLNTRCFEAAIESFAPLVDELASDTITRTPQDISRRSYFGKYDRPAAAATLDLGRPAAELEALVRAVDFGKRYPNELGSAKLHHGGRVFTVLRAEARPAQNLPAGTVITAEGDGFVVAAGEGSLALLQLTTLEGKALSGADAAHEVGARVGEKLPPLDPAVAEKLTALNKELARAESFWVRRLGRLEPAEIPYAAAGASARPGAGHERRPVDVSPEVARRFGEARADVIAAAFAALLARLSGKTELDLGFADAALAQAAAGFEAWVATEVPVHVATGEAGTFAGWNDRFAAELREVRKRRTWMRDLVARYPELAARPELHEGRLLPVGVRQTSSLAQALALPGSALTLVIADDGVALLHDPDVLPAAGAAKLARALETFLASAAADPSRAVAELDLLDPAERRRVLDDWNRTTSDYRRDVCVHQLFEEQAARTPGAVAVVFEGESLTYKALDEKSNQLAHHLRALGIGPDKLVGVCVERSLDLMVSILAVQKAGGAYVPLDPAYPQERLQYMIEDSKLPVLLTQGAGDPHAPKLDPGGAQVVDLDRDAAAIAGRPTSKVSSGVEPKHLAYVIYTSGSTGKPKGVMVEHRNVVNFFTGMDQRLAHDGGGVWLAVTSLSFDISVLELFYTLARGFKIVLYTDRDRAGRPAVPLRSGRHMDFGIFLWGNDEGPGKAKYRLMLESAKFADERGFSSIWTPERHFHAFGGPYPNPSITSAAIAAVTKRLRITAGSCVAPLHHPIRIAEEWSVVDNLSHGRVAVSWASGWQPDDFVLRPENYKDNKQRMADTIQTVMKLWKGEAVTFPGPRGDVTVKTLPRPVQPMLPMWITSAGNPDTYKLAGKLGGNILTHLLGQSVEEVAEKIKIYRQARQEAGHDPDKGIVTLMLHTFVGEDDGAVKRLVRQPMKDYLGASTSLIKSYAWAFPAFKRPDGAKTGPEDVDLAGLTPEENDAVLEFAFERYFNTSGLLGSVETCLRMIERLKVIGVDEIGCLIDFGVDTDVVIKGLELLDVVRARAAGRPQAAAASAAVAAPATVEDFSFAAQVKRHGVTHFQCTPSMARMLLMQEDSRAALATIQHMMVGGEALPVALAQELTSVVKGTVTNMYGPTETTIWSSTQKVEPGMSTIPIGTPIANTQLYVLDSRLQPAPVGVPGELYIGGDGVVRGYLNRPELTGERFLTDPFKPNGKIYKTGDLVRWREDGVVEFLGRTDFQVKIRGYRIELGEIESALGRIAGVREAVVVAREDTPGDQRLVAYVVPDGATPPDAAQLRDQLRAVLPEPMVPSAFVVLDALPLTPNGKVDRRALPAPEPASHRPKTDFVAPDGALQRTVAELWLETLGLKQVGVDDNFFEIGGHSLLVVRLHRQLREKLPDHSVAITDLYRFPTIRSFTESLTSGGKDERLQATAERAARRREALARRRQS